MISPTRELAIQIFEVLKKVGAFHEMSAGLIIGGKDVSQEQERVTRMNMLVCTPGRLLQHMDETYGFECSGLQMLVLDEADRILDMGFSATLSNIIENLPKERQTVLFSATLSKSVKDLARLSLRTPEYISIHESATYQTPTRLQQHYMVVDCSEKLDVLWSFIKTHLKQKTIVFLSSCNQVKFVHEAFCRLRPGIILSALHGKVKQEKRLQVPPPYSALHTPRTRPGDTQLVLLHDTDERLLTAREQHKHALRRSCAHVARRASVPRTSRHTASALCPISTHVHAHPPTYHTCTDADLHGFLRAQRGGALRHGSGRARPRLPRGGLGHSTRLP